MKIDINKIRIDGGTQCRVVIDQPTVYSYLEAMKDDAQFPLMETIFDGSTYWLTDGFHRYHAYKLLGIKEIEIAYVSGTLQDAQIAALTANSKHGKPLTNEDKRNKVEMALKIDGFDKKTHYEIAKLCQVSQSFVAAIRDPEVKKKQTEDKLRHIQKKADAIKETTSLTSNANSLPVDSGVNPDDEELKITELAIQADQETMYKLLESDDALATAHQEIKQLNLLNAQLQTRIHGLMNEKNAAVKMVKDLQKQLDKLKDK